jgi:hypothetical protein
VKRERRRPSTITKRSPCGPSPSSLWESLALAAAPATACAPSGHASVAMKLCDSRNSSFLLTQSFTNGSSESGYRIGMCSAPAGSEQRNQNKINSEFCCAGLDEDFESMEKKSTWCIGTKLGAVQEAPQHARGQGIKVCVEVPHHQRLHLYFYFVFILFVYLQINVQNKNKKNAR